MPTLCHEFGTSPGTLPGARVAGCGARQRGLYGLVSRLRLKVRVGLAMLTMLGVSIQSGLAHADRGPYEWALVKLDYARQEKVQALLRYCDQMHALAVQASQDKSLAGFFNVNLEYWRAVTQGPVPEDLTKTVQDMREGFDQYYIQNYLSFYDLLFIDLNGTVFYTLRKEPDLDTNLLLEQAGTNPLAICLKSRPDSELFVDFHEYGPSGEPAAFFVEPVRKDGVQIGWMALQCSVSKVNTLFAWTQDLGQTGETFLVNQEGYMLTESNFEGASTILKKRLDDRNIKTKFAEGEGHRTVTDYRGFTGLTSFEVVPFMGTAWLVVAKLDKDEVTTEHYALHRRYYADRLVEHLAETPVMPSRPRTLAGTSKTLRVDMDEFLRASQGERLETFGVSTCTCVVGSRRGRFGYLAHISPRDEIYGQGGTDLLGQMLMKIKGFDIHPGERRHVEFLVVATHLDSLGRAIDRILAEGFLISQIRVLHNPDAHYAQVCYDYGDDGLLVSWQMKDQTLDRQFHGKGDTVVLSEVIERLMAADDERAGAREAVAALGAGSRKTK